MSNNKDKYIISEFYAFQSEPKLIKEAEEKGLAIQLKGILQKADTINRNGRVYPFNILKAQADKYHQLVKERRALGECDHPESPIISLANVSHLITEMHWEGNTLLGTAEILDTPSGNILKGLMKSGVMLGISSRGVGSVKKDRQGRDVVQEDFELIGFDFVSSPSTPGAYMNESQSWGLKKLTDDDYKLLKNDTNNIEIFEANILHQKLKEISLNEFWKK
jgi:hypothetical protein